MCLIHAMLKVGIACYTCDLGPEFLLVKDFCYLRTVNVPAAVRSLSGWNIGTKVALDE